MTWTSNLYLFEFKLFWLIKMERMEYRKMENIAFIYAANSCDYKYECGVQVIEFPRQEGLRTNRGGTLFRRFFSITPSLPNNKILPRLSTRF